MRPRSLAAMPFDHEIQEVEIAAMTFRIRAHNQPYEFGSSPLSTLCHSGTLPKDARAPVTADWSDCSFVSIAQLAAVSAIQRTGASVGTEIKCIPSARCDDYISRMNYYRMIGIKHDERFKRHNSMSRFMPLTSISQRTSNDIAELLMNTVISHLNTDKSVADMINFAFGEMVDNVINHSGAPDTGIACAQYYKTRKYVDVCIVDCGKGIPSSMSSNPSYGELSNTQLLEKAFERETGEWFGVPSFGTEHVSGGMGLYLSARIMKTIGGIIWVVSHDSAIEISKDATKGISNMYYPGTAIVMRFPDASDPITGNDIFGNGVDEPITWSPSESWAYSSNDDDVIW